MTLRDLPERFEMHYITCMLDPDKCGYCRSIERELT